MYNQQSLVVFVSKNDIVALIMPTLFAPRFEDFKYTTEFDPDVINEAAELTGSRKRIYVKTGASSDTTAQELAVYLTVPEGVDRNETPVVRWTAFSDDNGRPGHFDALIAHELGRPMLSVNNPGVDFSEWRDPFKAEAHRLTPDQIEDLRKGSFSKVGLASMRALLVASNEFGLPDGYFFASSSMGTAVMAGALGAAEELGADIKGVAIEEGVNFRPTGIPGLRFVTLGNRFRLENEHTAGYLEQNPTYIPEDNNGEPISVIPPETESEWMGRVREAAGANLLYAWALRRGKWLDDIGLGDESSRSKLADQGFEISIGRGSESTLSSDEGDSAVENRLRKSGFEVIRNVYATHTHPYTMTAQSVVNAVDLVAPRS